MDYYAPYFLLVLVKQNRRHQRQHKAQQVAKRKQAQAVKQRQLPQTTSSTMSSSEVLTQDQANLVGTWQQPNQQLTVDALGNWQLTGNINSSGTLTVAADFE